MEYIFHSRSHAREYDKLNHELQDLQLVIDEWISLRGPLDDLLAEYDRKKQQLDELSNTMNRHKKAVNVSLSQVFKDTCSKYFFRKVKGVPGSIRQMYDNSHELVSTDTGVLDICTQFYEQLFHEEQTPSCWLSNYSTPAEGNVLSDDEQAMLAQGITKEDLEYSLAHMKRGKSPGLDGLTVEFYCRFWPVVGNLVIDSINEVQELGSFTPHQRTGILKLLPKPHKDPRIVRNLRLIMLLNMDYKLFTKVLSDRLKVVLPSIVHSDQNGFMKNRFLGNNMLDVYALIAIAAEERNDNMVLLSLDIEKAFDSVRWTYLHTVLWNFGFPEQFLQWVALMHQNASVQILNNGHLS